MLCIADGGVYTLTLNASPSIYILRALFVGQSFGLNALLLKQEALLLVVGAQIIIIVRQLRICNNESSVSMGIELVKVTLLVIVGDVDSAQLD